MLIPQLETPRLILRGFEEKDLDAYAEMCADSEVMRYFPICKTRSRAEAWRSMATIAGHWYLRGYGKWAVEERQSGETIGRVGCWQPEGWPGFEIGWMVRRSHWGQGFATEAAKRSIDFAFRELRQSRFEKSCGEIGRKTRRKDGIVWF